MPEHSTIPSTIADINFHPVIQNWFNESFEAPTAAQLQAWPAIQKNQHTLIAAPTGSGKTLAAFLSAIDQLIKQGLSSICEPLLPDETQILYISPLKALSNDVHKNLQTPLSKIKEGLRQAGEPEVNIRAAVRTGDTPQSERQQMIRTPPHILVTTPESLYIMLSSDSGRKILSTVKSVIIDEIHAVAGNKRGAHLSLSLERLSALCPNPITRIGLSATQNPIMEMALFLIGNREEEVNIIDMGHVRERDLLIETTASPLEALMANEVWTEIYNSLLQQISEHSTTLIFVNTRRMAERVAHTLAEQLGEEKVTAHHGSLSREHRQSAEQRLKNGDLSALVTTASLELGIDIGDVDLVCQLGSPRSISTFLQRVGRSGHSVGGQPKGRLYPLSRDDLIECIAILDAIKNCELDRINIPQAPVDVLAQQIIAEIANQEWDEDALYQCLTQARPYQDLTLEAYEQVVQMLADGYTTRRGRRGAYIHRDKVNKILRARRGAKLIAVTNAGAIPDLFDYDVILQPEGTKIGSLNEDFAFESLPGDIFQLGNTSYRLLKVEQGKVYAEDAHGQPPNIPFWVGEAPSRSDELSNAVSRIRQMINFQLNKGIEHTTTWIMQNYPVPLAAARQTSEYMAGAKATFGCIPDKNTIVFERFFDQTGDMHLIIHSVFGSRINRAWGLALRKRFCRKFNFELQAAASEDNLILSLSATHSFDLEDVINYLNPKTVYEVLVQAILTAPLFPVRWRWVANISLAIPRFRTGKRVPAIFQRNDSEDLIALVFPDQIACAENIAGEREIPDHPLVKQTLHDCTRDFMDIDGLIDVLQLIKDGKITLVCKDLNGPSPIAHEILNARPYAFLDDAPAEERRTLAVQQQRFMDPTHADRLNQLDQAAIDRVREEAWPDITSTEELHDAMLVLGFITEQEGLMLGDSWNRFIEPLIEQERTCCFVSTGHQIIWVARERLPEFMALYPNMKPRPALTILGEQHIPDLNDALRDILRSRFEGLGPVALDDLNRPLGLSTSLIESTLMALEQEGFIVRGRFTQNTNNATTPEEWCERGLLARVHRYTLKQLRNEIKPVSISRFMEFLFSWQHLDEPAEGAEALAETLLQLEGTRVSASAWEKDVLPARNHFYTKNILDGLCHSGRFSWQRAFNEGTQSSKTISSTLISILPRTERALWLATSLSSAIETLHGNAKKVYTILDENGASFFVDLVRESGLLPTQVEESLGILAASGLISSDSFAGLRSLISPQNKKPSYSRNRHRKTIKDIDHAGRWSLLPNTSAKLTDQQTSAPDHNANLNQTPTLPTHNRTQYIAEVLLRRYGVVFRKLLDKEPGLPPWRDLLYVFRRLEAQGQIRGGRFVEQFSGEQFALPEAIGLLRKNPHPEQKDLYITISASDPLNLTSIITNGDRVPASSGNRILYRNGIPLATAVSGNINFLQNVDSVDEWEIRNALIKTQYPLEYREATDHVAKQSTDRRF